MPYCPKCKSRLFEDDRLSMLRVGVCSGCVTYDTTPGRRLQATYSAAAERDAADNFRRLRRKQGRP